jgi:hypothetical protein
MLNEREMPDDGEQILLVEGTDFYNEDDLMVLTAEYLSRRGFCCGNLCRHCPYAHMNVPDHKR